MGQKPLLAFAIALILASSGCLGFGDDKLEQQENDDDKQEPVGETNMTSLEKRIEHLESTIAEYELPKVYFQEFGGDDVSLSGSFVNLADDGNLFCYYYEYLDANRCHLAGVSYDVNGIIVEFSWESSKGGEIIPTYGNYGNSDAGTVYAYGIPGVFLDVCDTEAIDPSHGDQIITFTVYDNDGNSASASYDLDYDSACTVVEPDNTCASDSDCPPGTICQGGVCVEDTSVCVDGDQMVDGGWTYTCVNGEWGSGEPVPDGTACDDDNPDTEYDVYINGICVGTPVNHAPVIDHLGFAGEFVTNETDYVCLDFNIYDEDGDEIDGIADWLINGVTEESMAIDVCFDIGSYGVAVGDELSVTVTVWDDEYEAIATIIAIIEEEPE